MLRRSIDSKNSGDHNLNQFSQLSHLISCYNILVHYVGSAIHNRQVKLQAHGLNPMDNTKIHFHEFSNPPFLSPHPNPHAPNMFPAHLHPSIEASMHLRQPISKLLHSLSPATKRMIIIHDPLMASVIQDAASIPNAEAYVFPMHLCFFGFHLLMGSLWKAFPTSSRNTQRTSIHGTMLHL